MSKLVFKLLGSPYIDIDGKRSDIEKSPKGLALVAFLLITRQSHSREKIADLLWDATTTAKSLNNLRQVLARLRRRLPELETSFKNLSFTPSGFVDVHKLNEGLSDGSTDKLDTALQLYQGELLEGVFLRDAPRFNEWLILERERLRRSVLAAYENLCRAYNEQKNWAKGKEAAQRWLALDELDETPLQYLIQFLAATGQTEQALQQYELFRHRLWLELEIEPTPELIQLANGLQEVKVSQEVGALWERMGQLPLDRPAPGRVPEPSDLPVNSYLLYQRNPDFIGRTSSLLRLGKLLLPPSNDEPHQHNTVAITGMGGLGKSQLAIEFCYRYGRYFPGGVYWLSFADTDSVPEEIVRIGGERGMGLYNESDDLRQIDKIGRVTKAWQGSIPRLLIFDNCESESLLAKWMPVSGGCAVLITSRRANWARELQVSTLALTYFEEAESIHLLEILLPTIEKADAQAMASELGHLPLALHLAGSFLRRYRQISAKQYLGQIQSKSLLAHPSMRGRGTDFSPTGHELDVGRTFAINWEQLDANDETDSFAIQTLAHAVQFAPGEPLERTLLVLTLPVDPDDLMQQLLLEDSLTRLISLGFINADGSKMIRIHRLIVAFVQSMLPDATIYEEAVAQPIVKQVADFTEARDRFDQLPISAVQLLHILETELAKATAEGASLALYWGLHLMDVGDLVNAQSYLVTALQIAEQVYGASHYETTRFLRSLATVTWQIDSPQTAKPYTERALAIYRTEFGEEHPFTARSINNLAIIHARMGNAELAIEHYKRALAIHEKLEPEDNLEIPRIHYNLGVTYYRQGNFSLSLSHYSTARNIYQAVFEPDHPQILQLILAITIVHVLLGNYEEAHEIGQQTLGLVLERLGEHHPLTSSILTTLGIALHFLNQPTKAIKSLEQSVAIRAQVYGEEHVQLVFTLTWLGYVLHQAGETDKGLKCLERGLAIQEASGAKNEQYAETLTRLADMTYDLGNPRLALTQLEQAMTIWEGDGVCQHPNASSTLNSLGDWHKEQGNLATAKASYEQAQALLAGRVSETHFEWKRVQRSLARLTDN